MQKATAPTAGSPLQISAPCCHRPLPIAAFMMQGLTALSDGTIQDR